MSYKSADDLLELVKMYFRNKMLFITKRTDQMLTIVKVLDNGSGIEMEEGDSFAIEEAY